MRPAPGPHPDQAHRLGHQQNRPGRHLGTVRRRLAGTGQKLSNQRALRADPYIEDAGATGVIGVDETAVRPEVLWKALAWAGVHVGIGAARKMGKGRFTLTPL